MENEIRAIEYKQNQSESKINRAKYRQYIAWLTSRFFNRQVEQETDKLKTFEVRKQTLRDKLMRRQAKKIGAPAMYDEAKK